MKKTLILLGIGTFFLFSACDDSELSEDQRLREGTRVGAPSTENPHPDVSPGTPGAGADAISPEDETTAEETQEAQDPEATEPGQDGQATDGQM
ncbi:MAG: hypothetical protein ACK4ND_15990 [Cytophagaceae bacterium]